MDFGQIQKESKKYISMNQKNNYLTNVYSCYKLTTTIKHFLQSSQFILILEDWE